MSVYTHKPPASNKLGLKLDLLTSNSDDVSRSEKDSNSGLSSLTSSLNNLESNKYSNALVSNRKALMRPDYKTQQQQQHSGSGKSNLQEKRLNFPLSDFIHLDKYSKIYTNKNNKNNINSSSNYRNTVDCNTSFHIKLPERHDFTASTASLIVHVPSLSYVSEQIDDDRSDNDFLRSDVSDNNHRSRNCPICNILYTDLQQQIDEVQDKRFLSLSAINVNTDTGSITNNENISINCSINSNNNISNNVNTSRLWDILESFSANSPRNFCYFHQHLSKRFSASKHISHNKPDVNLTTSLSLPCLTSLDESSMMITSTEFENNNINNNHMSYNLSYNKRLENTPSISIENADQAVTKGNNDDVDNSDIDADRNTEQNATTSKMSNETVNYLYAYIGF
uniref:RING-type domain-containing protein n=1 Tax=Trichobilharzia regenti TaxID=157069 RepID=A0AA85JLZ6_TRIRE|nr:unnamed protein product [Trichobilharzia regenti]